MILKLSKSTLRPWVLSDSESLVKNANSENIARFMRDVFPYPYTPKDAEFFIKNIASNTSDLVFAIEVRGEAVGSIGLHTQSDVYRHNAELGYWIGEKYQRQGITTEAIDALNTYAFTNLEINRIYAHVFENNIASKSTLVKCGFALEAIHRKAITKNNVVMDEHLYVRINEHL